MSETRNDPRESLDAIVLAGDRGAYKPVCGRNKALLQIEGVPVIAYVISALQRCRYVSRIFVVGPREGILKALEGQAVGREGNKEVVVLEQWDSFLENGWNTFLRTLDSQGPDGRPLPEEALRARYEGKAVLFLGSDTPLLTPYELEEFIEGCDVGRYDYIVGTTPAEALKPYYPDKGVPGIRLSYFHFKDSRERQNNLHMIRVFRVINPHYAQLMYRFRHQKRWRNILLLFRALLDLPEFTRGMIVRFLLLHACRVLGRIPWMPLNRLLRRFLDKARLEHDIGALLRTRFAMTTTTYGGAALDIDDEEQFAVICSRFHRWRAFQEDLHGGRRWKKGECRGVSGGSAAPASR
jgi:molybdopterin-guanine dinucleotide biosynthesis protein A